MKNKYSIAFYTGGIDIDKWDDATKEEQAEALSKEWYLRWSFRKNEHLIRQPNVKAGINYLKTKKERIKLMEAFKKELIDLLETGWTPYEKDRFDETTTNYTIEESIDFVRDIWSNSVASSTFQDYKSRMNKFQKWLHQNGFKNRYIKTVTRKVVTIYLNEVLKKTSPKNRNNQRACLSSFFSVLEKNEYIISNPCDKIDVVKAKPKRNKTYTETQEKQIFDYLEVNDKLLLLFIKFVSYNFLRPIEVARLQIKDIDFEQKRLSVQTKTENLKTKIIPEILFQEIKHLKGKRPEAHLFSPTGVAIWETSEVNRRDYWSKRFKKVKDELKLSTDYGIYSFRHTFITKLYRELRKQFTPFEVKSRLMLITGHTTVIALDKYLRDIDAELPEDYSEYLK